MQWSAEIVLVRNDLMDVARAIKLSNKTFSKIKQNIFWALFYNTILILSEKCKVKRKMI